MWDFGNGLSSAEVNPSIVYEAAGSYTVTLIAGNEDRQKVVTGEVVILPAPVSCFTMTEEPYYTGDTIRFENCSENATYYEWDFGNGSASTDEQPYVVYNEPGNYTIKLVAGNEFKESTTEVVVAVTEGPTACFEITQDSYFVNEVISFTNCSSGSTVYAWDFGNGSSSEEENPTLGYPDPGEYTVKLTAGNGEREDTFEKVIVINPHPDAVPCFEWDEPIYELTPVTFHNCSQHADSYEWKFNFGHYSDDAVLTASFFEGTYTISLVATGPNGPVQLDKIITVLPVSKIVSECGDRVTDIEPVQNGYKALTSKNGGGQVITLDQDFEEVSSAGFIMPGESYPIGFRSLSGGQNAVFSNKEYSYYTFRSIDAKKAYLIFQDQTGAVAESYQFDTQTAHNRITNIIEQGTEIFVVGGGYGPDDGGPGLVLNGRIMVFNQSGELQQDILVPPFPVSAGPALIYNVFKTSDNEWIVYGGSEFRDLENGPLFVARYSSTLQLEWSHSFNFEGTPDEWGGIKVENGAFDEAGNFYLMIDKVTGSREFVKVTAEGLKSSSTAVAFGGVAGITFKELTAIKEEHYGLEKVVIKVFDATGELKFSFEKPNAELFVTDEGNLGVLTFSGCGANLYESKVYVLGPDGLPVPIN